MRALWEYIAAHHSQLFFDSYQHVSAVVQSVLIATIIGVAVGVLTYRNSLAANLATATSSVILTVPAFALLGLLIPLFGLGVVPSVAALVLYSLLPIIRNTIVGLDAVDPALTDAARGLGLSRLATLSRVELRLVWPSILSAMRISTQMSMGVLAIAAYVKGPGLGNLIFAGLAESAARPPSRWRSPEPCSSSSWRCCSMGILVLLGRSTTSKGIR